jgi:tetratricopeptide (TPR) repeat protein
MRMVNYRLGRIYYKREQYEKAITYLDKAIRPLDGELEERTERYKVYSYLQKGYSLTELNMLDKAKDQFEIVLTYENYRNSHDLARKQLKRIENLKNKKK